VWSGAAGGTQIRMQHSSGGRVHAFSRTKGSNTVVVVTNFANTPARVAYSDFSAPATYTDWFSKLPETLGVTGLIQVPANGYRVLVK
jgi:hypothetical protein